MAHNAAAERIIYVYSFMSCLSPTPHIRALAVTLAYNSSTFPPTNISATPHFSNFTIANLTVATAAHPARGKSVGFASEGLNDSVITDVTLADVNFGASDQPIAECKYTSGRCLGTVAPGGCPACLGGGGG